MRVRWHRLLPLLTVAICALTAAVSLAATSYRAGPLTGTWSGYLRGAGHYRRHMVIVIDASERGGRWWMSRSCYGPLTLDSISNGYHHYLRRRGRGARCAGGDIDCLKRARADLYDAVTSRPGGAYDVSGTFRRVRPA